MIFEMDIFRARAEGLDDLCQSKVVCGDHAHGTALDEASYNSCRSDSAIV
jgi:hypothetical protein